MSCLSGLQFYPNMEKLAITYCIREIGPRKWSEKWVVFKIFLEQFILDNVK